MATRNTKVRGTSSRHSSKSGGFSLIEVLIVLVVIAMMAAVVGPGIGASLGSVSRHTVQRDVEIQLLEARLQAIDTGTPAALSDPGAPRTPAAANHNDVARVALTLPPGWSYRVQNTIEFRPDGGCAGGLITLEKPGERILEVPIDSATCRTRRGR